MIPPAFADTTTVCGNAAATGGAMLLLDSGIIPLAEQIAQTTQTVQLADLPDFQALLCRFTALE